MVVAENLGGEGQSAQVAAGEADEVTGVHAVVLGERGPDPRRRTAGRGDRTGLILREGRLVVSLAFHTPLMLSLVTLE